MVEARKHERSRSFLSAVLSYNNGATTLNCVIKNISQSGAKLMLADSVTLPDEFELRLPHKSRTYRARITWREATSLGVQFLDIAHGKSGASAPKDHAARTHDELQRENAELKAQIRKLRARLESIGQDPDLSLGG